MLYASFHLGFLENMKDLPTVQTCGDLSTLTTAIAGEIDHCSLSAFTGRVMTLLL
jgi:hypothetical protein